MNQTFKIAARLKGFTAINVTFFLLGFSLASHAQINYLDQKPPGRVAEVFAPGIVSTSLSEHSAPAFSPDGSVVIWTVMDKRYRGYLLEMKYENGSWSKRASPSFADTASDDFYASFSTDGKKLFFSSRRKLPGMPGKDQHLNAMRIWQVERIKNGWGTPVPFDTTVSHGYEYAHSTSADGTLYFSAAPDGEKNLTIYRSPKINGRNIKGILLPGSINTADYEDGPYIDPTGTFLIFESQRPESIDSSLDLFICFKDSKGGWQTPVNMGPQINSRSGERFARLSPDGKYFFFGSSRNMSQDH